MKLTIVKYEEYPKDTPSSYAVGFDVKLYNGRGFYVDTLVPFSEIDSGLSDEEISTLAYNKLHEDIENKVDQLQYATPAIIGLELEVTVEHQEAGSRLRLELDDVIVGVGEMSDVIDAMMGVVEDVEA